MLDNLERAPRRPRSRSTATSAEGIARSRLVHEELAGVLRGAGIESYSPQGEPFDPD